jgi:hypothetical protein
MPFIMLNAFWFWSLMLEEMLADLAVATGQKPAPVLVVIRGGRA